MVLHIDSDVAYLVTPQSKSRIVVFYYVSNNGGLPSLNGGMLLEFKTLRRDVASAAEVEVAGVFAMHSLKISYNNFKRNWSCTTAYANQNQ